MFFYEYLFSTNTESVHTCDKYLCLSQIKWESDASRQAKPSEASLFLTPRECLFLEITAKEYVCVCAALAERAWRFAFCIPAQRG